MRRGVYTGPLVLNWVAIGGGADGPEPVQPDGVRAPRAAGRVLTMEPDAQRAAAGHHGHRRWACTCAWASRTTSGAARASASPACSRWSRWCASRANFTVDVAGGGEARRLYRIGEHYGSADETLTALGWAPNRREGERGMPLRRVA